MDNWSSAVPWITLIVAIISPIVTTKINAKHQVEIKKLELFSQKKTDAFEYYLKATTVYFSDCRNNRYFEEYLLAKGRVSLYVFPPLLEKINLFHIAVSQMRFENPPLERMNEIYSLWNEITIDLARTQLINEI